MKLSRNFKFNHLLTFALIGALSFSAHADHDHDHSESSKEKTHKMDKHDEAKHLTGPTLGEKVPNFTLKSSEGKDVSLSDYKGKLVVLEWTNHECPFVKKHYSSNNMQNLQKKYTDKDVVWLSIVSSAPGNQGHVDGKKAQMLTKERSASPSHVLFDPSGSVGKQYQAKTTPHMYIVNTEC